LYRETWKAMKKRKKKKIDLGTQLGVPKRWAAVGLDMKQMEKKRVNGKKVRSWGFKNLARPKRGGIDAEKCVEGPLTGGQKGEKTG